MPDDESAKRDEVLKRLLQTPPQPKDAKRPRAAGRSGRQNSDPGAEGANQDDPQK